MIEQRYFDVTYLDGAVAKVKPLPRAKWADLMELQRSLLEEFARVSYCPGDLIFPENKKVWSLLAQAVTLLPTISTEPLDLDQMDDEEILATFFTETSTRDADGALMPTDPTSGHSPSRIAKLHGFSFFRYDRQGLLQRASSDFMEKWKAEQQKKMKAEERKELQKVAEKQEAEMPLP